MSYVIKAIGIYTIAKREGADYPWLAFVPFAKTYLQGELGGEIVLKKKSIKSPGIWLLVLPFVEVAAFVIMYLGLFAIIGFSTFSYASSYYDPGMSAGTVVMLILFMVLFVLIMVVFGAALQVLRVLVNSQILGKFTTRNMSVVHAILMGIIPLYESICFLVMSRKPYNPGMEPPKMGPFMQTPPQGPNPYVGGPNPNMGESSRNMDEPNSFMGGPARSMGTPVQPQGNMEPRVQEPVNQESGFVPQRGLVAPVQPEVQSVEKAEAQSNPILESEPVNYTASQETEEAQKPEVSGDTAPQSEETDYHE